MKLATVVCILLTLGIGLHSQSTAQDNGIGLGVIVGEPTGVSFKGWISKSNAIDAALAWSFVRETSLHVHADYLVHAFDVFDTRERIPLYYGIGGRIKTSKRDDAQVGVRAVVGIAYMVRNAPLDIFLEVAPILDLAPKTELLLNAGLGARYYFE